MNCPATISALPATSPISAAPSTATDADPFPETLSVPPASQAILAERWPTLSRALGRYEQNVAERFTRTAYDRVEAGIIRFDDRRELAAEAGRIGLRPFDAQLLIACAIRQWALDHRYDATPSPKAPQLSFEYRAWGRLWVRLGLVACTAVILDAIIIWKWLS